MEDGVEEMYNVFTTNKQKITKRTTNFSLSTLITLKKRRFKKFMYRFWYLDWKFEKKHDLILLIVDYQQDIENEQENDADVLPITDLEEEESLHTSVSFTFL